MSERAPRQDLGEMYDLSYQSDSIAEERVPAWRHIAGVLFDTFRPKSHLDVGAGAGPLVRAMLERGVDSWGIEGSPYGHGLGGDRIIQHDLREELLSIDLKGGNADAWPFDLVTCFDTAEHVEDGGHVVDILADMATDVIVFGAAAPGQDGHGHVFLKPYDYWHAEFAKRGFELSKPFTNLVWSRIEADDVHAKIWWVRKNLHVYIREPIYGVEA